MANNGEQWRTIYWRREWDSNPRYSFPHTRFPSVRLKPLGHLSGSPSLEGAGGFLQGSSWGASPIFAQPIDKYRLFRVAIAAPQTLPTVSMNPKPHRTDH
jgi:hypothetical protein